MSDIFSAQADAFRALMVGTGGGAMGAPTRFVSVAPAMDIFATPKLAWQTVMRRGIGEDAVSPSARVVSKAKGIGSYVGITHKCDGCADGEPCAECGGNIPIDHPAYRAVQWAQTMDEGRTVRSSGRQWMLASVASMVDRSNMPSDDVTDAVRGFLAGLARREQRVSGFWSPEFKPMSLVDLGLDPK